MEHDTHELVYNDIEQGEAGPCKVCETLMASKADDFVCTSCADYLAN